MLRKDHFSDSNELKKQQYNNADKLSARIHLHQNYSTNDRSMMSWLFDVILENSPNHAKVLEIGTGRGDLWQENSHRIPDGWDLLLTDLSEGMIADNQNFLGDLSQRMTYEVVNANSIPYADNSFDILIANYMLYHVPDRQQALSEMRRVLKPDGILFAATNGNGHMKQIYVLAQQVDEITSWQSIFEKTFSLQNGTGQLMPFFTDIRMKQYINDLFVLKAQPIIDYVRSMVSIDGVSVLQSHEADIRQDIEKIIADKGGVWIGKETGLFIASGTRQKMD